MAGLTENDLVVLGYYAENGMRERYWNYLANPTNERSSDNGYGLLAMGVVRNDNMSGAIANNYAQNYVQDHPINGKRQLSEQAWERVGVDLIKADYKIREGLVNHHQNVEALNLPVNHVYAAHIEAFEKNGISTNAWTPAILINASYERTGNFNESNQIWKEMLNNEKVGLSRLSNTLGNQWNNSRLFDGYAADQTKATAEAALDLRYNDPSKIGNRYDYYHKVNGQWHHDIQSPVHGESNPMSQRAVTDPDKIRELNAISLMRDERNHQSDLDKKHPKDPNNNITRSQHTIVDNREYGHMPQFAFGQTLPKSELPANASVMDIINNAYAAAVSKDSLDFDKALHNTGQTQFAQGMHQEAKALMQTFDVQQQALAQQLVTQSAEMEAPVMRGPVLKL